MAGRHQLGNRRCLIKLCKSFLLLTLVVSVMVNISFILETNKNLAQKTEGSVSQYEEVRPQDYQHGSYDNVQARSHDTEVKGHDDNKVMEMEVKDTSKHGLIEVTSSQQLVHVKINGRSIYTNDAFESDRGIHILVLNQATLEVMGKRVFDTYLKNEDDAMIQFLSKVSKGRILIYAIKDEGSFQLKESSRRHLKELGSEAAVNLHWRDMWAFVCMHGQVGLGEKHSVSKDLSSWGEPTILSVDVTLGSMADTECSRWPVTDETRRRRQFCNKYEGYGAICDCDNPEPLHPNISKLSDGSILDIPVAVIASNRPAYLFRMLRTLLSTPGVPVSKITVFIDGHFDEPLDVVRLLNLRGVQHVPLGMKNARISQHYKASITATFEMFPDSGYIILIEEDLDVSPDFFFYFQQTKPLLEDSTLYCVSAWNDQGYDHSCKDAELLYRIETMPGLGWMMKRSLFVDELQPQWPSSDKQWDWDMWMRADFIRKSRECIIPDVSRTYHFGAKGLNINPYFQDMYFTKHKLQSKPNVRLKDLDNMKSDKYEELVRSLIKSAKVLDHTKDPCGDSFIPKTEDETFVMYIKMKDAKDFETWKQLAKCYNLWDLDVRGFHKSMWRQFLHDKHLIIVGVPASPYSDLKPADVTPIYLPSKDKKE